MENKNVLLFKKEYRGFESVADIERDISEMWEGTDIPAEFEGTLIVTVEYKGKA